MTISRFGFWLGLLLLASLSRAQTAVPLAEVGGNDPFMPRWVVKFAPLSLVDPDNTIQFAAERRLGRRNAVQAEAGYGFQGMNLWQNSQNTRYTDREVWRGRIEWRHYFQRSNWPQGPYMALETFYKQVNVRENGTVGVGCSGGPCQYYQQFTAPLQKYVWGGHIKFGGQASLTADERLFVDVYMGVGFRNRQVERFRTDNADGYVYGYGYSIFDSFSPVAYPLLSLSGGMKIGYSL